jgi:hypothetical protein
VRLVLIHVNFVRVRESSPRGSEGRILGGRRQAEAQEQVPAQPAAGVSNWQLMLPIWPLDDRPALMRDPAVVNGMELEVLLTYKKNHEDQVVREGKGREEFGKDRKLPTRSFPAQDDNCMELLHDVR